MATSIDRRVRRRVARLAERQATTEAAIYRLMILRQLPVIEREVLGGAAYDEKKEGVPA